MTYNVFGGTLSLNQSTERFAVTANAKHLTTFQRGKQVPPLAHALPLGKIFGQSLCRPQVDIFLVRAYIERWFLLRPCNVDLITSR